ncbi:MAG: Smr/MutS family protein [Alkalilacustris sp.]
MTRRRAPRGLRPDERDLWRRVAETTRPIRPEPPILTPVPSPAPDPRPEPSAPEPPRAVPLAPFRVGSLRGTTVAAPPQTPPAAPRMDAKAYRRLTRGKLVPEARIDLHGMTLAEAHPALSGFLRRAQAEGRRLVLVITGKGRGRPGDPGPLPYRQGALRHEVPLWLQRPPLRPLVQQTATAHARHGGEGALYVYLRKPG